MKCPTCPDVTLELAERRGVEIDYCPQCRGVWLDRGELDKILERSVVVTAAPAAAQSSAPREQSAAPAYHGEDYGQPGHGGHGGQRGHHGNKRRKSWLYDIFD